MRPVRLIDIASIRRTCINMLFSEERGPIVIFIILSCILYL